MGRIKSAIVKHPKLTGAIVGTGIIVGTLTAAVPAYAWNFR